MTIYTNNKFTKYIEDLNEKKSKFSKEAHFLIAKTSDNFISSRSPKYLKKITDTHSFFRNQIIAIPSNYLERKILFKFLKVKFLDSNYSKTLGIALAFNFFSEYERFGFKHLSQVLKKLVPGIRVTEDTFYSAMFVKEKIIFCYIELEKIRGKHLLLNEYIKLKKSFPQEVINGIEFSSPNLFIPKNEEETYKNISRLNYELESPTDLPHVMIFFSGQTFDKLTFSIILVRMLKPDDTPIKALIEKLCLRIQFQIQKLSITQSKHMKEISMFTIELNSFLFSRRNHLVDLLKARHYITIMLEQAIGEFRDYNGGLLSKQTEQFDLIKKKFKIQIKDFSFYEELFFSLTPSSLQPLISPNAATQFFDLFSKIKSIPVKNLYELKFFKSDQALSVIVKTSSNNIKSSLEDIAFDDSMTVAKIIKTIDQHFYCCFLQLSPFDLSLLKQIENELCLVENELNICTKKILRISFQGDLSSFHPHFNSDPKDTTICKALFEGLTRINLNGDPELAVARDIKISPCKKKYIIILKSVKWSNGEEVTANHFYNAWKKAISTGSKCLDIKRFLLIKNVRKIFLEEKPIEDIGVYVISNKKLIIELEYPAPYFLQLLADTIYSPLYEFNNQEPKVFNGPFLFEKIRPNREISLVPNSFYWDVGNINLKKIKIYLNKDIFQAKKMYDKGELDYLGSPINVLSKEIIQNSNDLVKTEGNGIFWLFCNTKNIKLKSSKIRKALSLAINRSEIINKILPQQSPCSGAIPENISFFKSNNFFSKKNINEVRSLFQDGLYDIGLKKEDYILNLSYSNISPERKQLTFYFKEAWEKAFNIQVNIKEKEWDLYWNSLFNYEYEIGGYCTLSTFKDPMYFLEPFQISKSNLPRWESLEFQNHIKLAINASTKSDRDNQLKKAEEILLEEMPIIPIYSDNHLFFCKKELKNFSPLQLVYSDFKWAYFDE
jgi:oligopeptide transport system substrate-binding protein